MNIEELRNFCLSKPHVTEGFPFDEKTLVFKVAGKLFALTGLEHYPASVNLKCDPNRSLDLREEYEHISPGYHMNKKHWNTVVYESLPDAFLKELIDHSYDLASKSLTKAKQKELGFIS